MGQINKGYIASIHGNVARVVPADSSTKPTARITTLWLLRGEVGNLKKGTEVVYVDFDDATGLLLARADGEGKFPGVVETQDGNGNVTYEIVDEKARQEIETLKKKGVFYASVRLYVSGKTTTKNTYTEIKKAYGAGQVVMCKLLFDEEGEEYILPLNSCKASAQFALTNGAEIIYVGFYSDGTVEAGREELKARNPYPLIFNGTEYDGSEEVTFEIPETEVDPTLKVEGKAADAKATGTALAAVDGRVSAAIQAMQENADYAPEAEIIDARVGPDGTQYALVGDNIRAMGDALLALEDELKEFVGKSAVDGLLYEGDMLYLTSGGNIVSEGVKIVGGSGGGGGGSTNNAVLTVTNTSGWLSKSVSQGADCFASFTWSSLEGGLPTGNGVMTVYVNNTLKTTREITQGDVSLNVGGFLGTGSNTVRIRVADVYGNVLSLNLNVAVIALSVSSTFDAGALYTDSIIFTYTPYGSVTKNMEFWLDGVKIGTNTVATSGRQVSFTIPAQSHGSHFFEVFCTAEVDGDTIESNHLYYDIMCAVTGNTTPIIASAYRGGAVEQYDTVQIPFRVYDPTGLTTTITQAVNGGAPTSLTVDRTEQIWSYFVESDGTVELIISCGSVRKIFTLEASASDIQVEAETEALALYLTSYGRSNNEDTPGIWKHGNISASLTGFNFVSDGWQLDADGVTVLRVAGDARVTIPYRIFANDFRTSGKTIEIEFATRDVLNYDAVLLSCKSGGRGLEVTTQKATLTSEQSSIGTQYKEEEHVRLSFVVEKRANNRLLLCYINGILSGSVRYPEADDFSQSAPVGITIGSNDCTTDIYNIRIYDNDLTRYQILDNWIADTRVASLLRDRYLRNDIYNAYGIITIDTIKDDLPYLVIEGSVSPQFKGDKKTCSGYYVDPVNSAKSFTFDGATVDVQGTSSQYYYVKNYKIKFGNGFTLPDGTVAEEYQMNDNSVPTKTFTFKADVASSEGANNVILAELYNELCPVLTPPQQADARVRQTIEGHPIVIFWDYGDGPVFVGKYNFNNDKGTEEVFGFEDGDESWEILQNGTDRVGWKSADFSGDAWKNDFEARFPEDNTDTTNLQAFAEWLVSTNTEAATGASIPAVTYDGVEYTTDSAAYRLAKFKAEFSEHADVDAMVFYYVITELFLCIDQREKNAFPTLWQNNPLWMMLFYDADSSLGIDNKGNLAFDYYLEDIDYTEAGDPVFNGQGSVLWVNLRPAFYDKIAAEYKRLRTTIRGDGTGNPLISYDVVNNLFEAHQGKWCEAIYNEDGYKKCIEPLVQNGDTLYLPMLRGKKEQQRKWWLYNRFRYLDSKYVTGSSMETRITIRAHAKANVTLTAYVNMYGHVYYNAEMVEHRMYRGQPYEFVWAASGAEDAVIGINDADMLTSLGDLSPLMVELIDISKATHLTYLKVGDTSADYENKNLNSITLGNNVLLRTIDLRNCSALTQAVDASGCTGLEEVYLDGTSTTALTLPNGGGVKIIHLPDTIANLTLRNQTALTEFVMPSYANVTTLRLENNSSVIDPFAILEQIADNSRVRIIGFDRTMTEAELKAFLDKLDTMRGIDENGNNTDTAQVSGRIYVEMINGSLLKRAEKYVGLTVEYGSSYLVSTRLVERTLSGEYVNDRVTSVGDRAFSGCTMLTAVSFSNELSIGSRILDSCTSLKRTRFEKSVSMKFDNYPLSGIPSNSIVDFCEYVELRYRTFNSPGAHVVLRYADGVCPLDHTNIDNASGKYLKVYVPSALLEEYKSATNWSGTSCVWRAIEDYTVDGTITGEIDLTKI